MKKIHVLFPAFLLLFTIAACGPKSSQDEGAEIAAEETQQEPRSTAVPLGDNSRVSLDWDGIYTGTVPCADCAGIKTMIQLNKDETYTMKTRYLGKSDEVFTVSGKFVWNDAGSTITLEDAEGITPLSYQVGENILFHLDQDGNRVTGDLAENYQLRKQQKSLVGKRWKLVEIMGKPVADMDLMKEPFIELTGEADGWRFAGNDGCNNIMGSYEMGDAGTISFSKPASTMMACPKGDLQQEMADVLGQADNFTMSEDGATLSLNKARMAPLARFEVDYLGGE